MCGITGYVGNRSSVEILLQGLRLLEYRGYDSWGIAVPSESGIHVTKQVGKISEASIDATVSKSSSGIGHTRWATHGAPTIENAHPHINDLGTIAVVHNGIIENATKLRLQLQEKGHVFRSDTDTEVIPHLISDHHDGNPVEALKSTLQHLIGAFAIAVVFSDTPNTLYTARRGSPLAVGIAENETFIASDPSAFVAHTRKVVYLDDDDVACITRGKCSITHIAHGPVTRTVQEIPYDAAALSKNGFESFMLKEIYEQPESLHNTFRGRLLFDNATTRLDGLNLSDREIREITSLKILACGTSWHAGLLGKYLIEEFCRIPTEVDYAAEFRYRNPIVPPNCLTLAISQSGETADTLAAAREASLRGSTVAGICNVVGSTLARECGRGIYLHAGPEIGVASTKAFTSQVMALALLAIRLGRARDLGYDEALTALSAIQSIPTLLSQVLEQDMDVGEIAKEVFEQPNFLFIGRRYQFPVALEGALKLKELSYIHAEGLQAAELKHGPIALVDENMPIVVLATDNDILDKVKSNVQEIRARHGRIIACVSEGCTELDDLCDSKLEVPRTLEFLTPLLSVVPLQLLAYHISRLRGCDVDKPRNLAKSVTVE